MALMLAELYDALREAGASEDKARAAAESVAQLDVRLGRIETKLSVLIWAVDANVAATIATFGMLVTMNGRLGEISGQLSNIAHLLQR
jgi:hypothetical protein